MIIRIFARLTALIANSDWQILSIGLTGHSDDKWEMENDKWKMKNKSHKCRLATTDITLSRDQCISEPASFDHSLGMSRLVSVNRRYLHGGARGRGRIWHGGHKSRERTRMEQLIAHLGLRVANRRPTVA